MRYLLILGLILMNAETASSAYAQQTTQSNFVDRSIASLSGSSQSLISGVGYQRKYLFIQNTGSAGNNIGVNPNGGTAAIGGTGTITLVPGESLEYKNGTPVPSNIINVIGTSGQPVTCIEGK